MIAVKKAVEAGQAPADTLDQIKAGKVKLKEAVKKIEKPKPAKTINYQKAAIKGLNKLINQFGEDHADAMRQAIREALQ